MIEKYKLYEGKLELCFDSEKHVYTVDNKKGFQIENENGWVGRQKHSWFRLKKG